MGASSEEEQGLLLCAECTIANSTAIIMSSLRRGARGGMPVGKRPVSETARINISERLEQFRSSPQQEVTFESGLNNHERAVIHELCRKMGLKSKSSGKGGARRISVFKIGGCLQKDQSVFSSLSFSAEARGAVLELFSCHPPTEDEASWKVEDMPASQKHTSNSQKAQQAPNCPANVFKPVMGQSDITKQVEMLGARLQSTPTLQQITQERATLPIAKFKDEITSCIEKNQVVLIAGETGCGKTTQVPQFILDHMWSQGRPCKILCTQPRRISATSVAERIATERGEPVGQTVGYQIQLESKGGRHSSLMFCTNGVLLRKLVNADGKDEPSSADKGLGAGRSLDATHLVVDEIHERDRYADFMLIALRDLLPMRPDMRLILMSATLDAELFSKYFFGCPIIRIPGFTYPVQSFYLEDVIVATEVGEDFCISAGTTSEIDESVPLTEEDADAMDEAICLAWLEDDFDLLSEMVSRNLSPDVCNYQHSLTGATALMVAAGKGKVELVLVLLSKGADCNIVSQDGSTALDWANRGEQQEVRDLLLKHMEKKGDPTMAIKKADLLERYLSSIDQEEVDTALIERLLCKICTSTTAGISPAQNGAILIFLPGWEDITRTRERLQASALFSDATKFQLLPLHSMIPSSEQKKVFKTPQPGIRKIVLATNIAETAITINDVVFVIDSGRIKEKSYDPYSSVSTLQTAWISKASSRQREGRAGRCQPGVCYHLYSKVRAAALPEFQIPEIKRTPLEELCLQVKLLDSNCNIRTFLRRAVDPPNDLSVCNAIHLLQDIGALTSDERLTELGKQLGSLPVHPSTSKMLLLGILLNCLDPALTIACAAGYRDPFVLPTAPEQRRRAFAAKRELAAAYGGYSDHLAIVGAFDRWEKAKSTNSENRFCEKHFLSAGTMAMLAGMRQQLQKELAQKGFIPKEQHPCSLNAHDSGIVRALLVAGLYPMVGTLLPPLPSGQKAVVQTAQGKKVRIHPHSANFHLVHHDIQRKETINRPLLVFDEITRGEAWMYIRNSTLVKPHPLLLIATEMVVAPLETGNVSEGEEELSDSGDDKEKDQDGQQEELMSNPDNYIVVVVDRWLKFQATAVEAAQLYCLRERLAAAVSFKIKNPRKVLPPVLGASIFTIACILSYDGSLDIDMPSSKQTFSSSTTGAQNSPSPHHVKSLTPIPQTLQLNHETERFQNVNGSKSGKGSVSKGISNASRSSIPVASHNQLAGNMRQDNMNRYTRPGSKKLGSGTGHYVKRPRK